MNSAALRRCTVEEYLERERLAETKSEFYDGEIFAMAGATASHGQIVRNLFRLLEDSLRNGPCQVHGPGLRTRLSSGLYCYPDVIIVCGKPEFAPDEFDNLLNPTTVIEVLSPITEKYDTGKKFRWYQETPSIQEIGFVSQDETRFQVFSRSSPKWEYDEAVSLDGAISMRSGNVALKLSDVYRNVEFANPDSR
jgi:Uma2 family endonuclease